MANPKAETLSLPKLPAPVFPDKLTISNSLAKDWRACRRKFYLHYMARLEPKRLSIPFLVGSAFHKGIERFYQGQSPDEFIPEVIKTIEDKAKKAVFLTPEDEENVMMQTSIVTGMLKGYTKIYATDLKKWKIVETEFEFSVPIKEGELEYVGQIDLVVEIDKKLWLVEHKTAGRLDKNYIDRLALDTQITGYAIGAAKKLGRPIVGVIYNVAKKPQLRQKKSESPAELATRIEEDYLARPEFYFYREQLFRDVGAVAEYKAEIAELAADIQDVTADLKERGDAALPRFYRNTDACTARGQCAYMAICTKGWNDETHHFYTKRDKLNPELGNVETEGEEGGGD